MNSPAEIIDAALFERMGCRPPGMTKHVVQALAEAGYRIVPYAPSITMCEAGAVAFVHPEKILRIGQE